MPRKARTPTGSTRNNEGLRRSARVTGSTSRRSARITAIRQTTQLQTPGCNARSRSSFRPVLNSTGPSYHRRPSSHTQIRTTALQTQPISRRRARVQENTNMLKPVRKKAKADSGSDSKKTITRSPKPKPKLKAKKEKPSTPISAPYEHPRGNRLLAVVIPAAPKLKLPPTHSPVETPGSSLHLPTAQAHSPSQPPSVSIRATPPIMNPPTQSVSPALSLSLRETLSTSLENFATSSAFRSSFLAAATSIPNAPRASFTSPNATLQTSSSRNVFVSVGKDSGGLGKEVGAFELHPYGMPHAQNAEDLERRDGHMEDILTESAVDGKREGTKGDLGVETDFWATWGEIPGGKLGEGREQEL